MRNLLLIILAILMLADLYFVSNHQNDNRFFTKTFLLPIIILIYIVVSKSKSKLFIFGLIFSFLGDLFLLFDWGFLLGLGSFLVAHIFYILSFWKKIQKQMISIIPILLLYLIGLIIFLFPFLQELKIPVVVYGIVITTMLYCAVCTQNQWLIIGALLFVCSDSLLSINVFYEKSTWREILVMLTYVSAQTCFVFGMRRMKTKRKKRIIQQ